MKRDLETPRRLHALVVKYPGIHLRELAREADVSEAHALHHLDRLVQQGVIRQEMDGLFRRFYSASERVPSEEDRALLVLLRRRIALQLSLHLLEKGSATFSEIGELLGLSKSTVSYHLTNLEKAGLVVQDASHAPYRLKEPRRVERLLVQWQPTEDVTERFQRLWSGFFRRAGGQA